MKINFDKQYNECYKTRMAIMSKLILNNKTFQEYGLPLRSVSHANSEECIVIGTLFLRSDTKYSILKKNNKEDISSYWTEDAVLSIEDMTGKIEVVFDEVRKITCYVSGMVIGFVGKVDANKIFKCSDVIFPVLLDKPKRQGKGRALLVSNLVLEKNNAWRVKLLWDICWDKFDEAIVIGDVFGKDEINYDKWIDEIKGKVSFVPGLGDSTTQLLPQEPFPVAYFKKQNKNKLNLLSNPGTTDILGCTFVFLTHHIVNDIAKYIPKYISKHISKKKKRFEDGFDKKTKGIYESYSITDDDRIKVLEQIVKMRYLVPNAPETIGSVPYIDTDPFVLNNCDILVTGGCEIAIRREFENRTLLGVPDFNKTGKAIILDLETYEIQEIEVL